MEEHFRKKLKNHKVDWNKEELLGSLEQELSQKKSRFNWKLLLLLPLLFIGTCWVITGGDFRSSNSTILSRTESTSINNSARRNSEIDNQVANQTKASSDLIINNSERNQLAKTNHFSLTNNDKYKSEFPINAQSKKSVINSDSNVKPNDSIVFFNKKALIIEDSITQNLIPTAINIKQTINSTATQNTEIISSKIRSAYSEDQEIFKLTGLLPSLEISMIPFDRQVHFKFPEQNRNSAKSILNIEPVKFKNSFFISSSIEAGAIIHQTTNYPTNDKDFLELLINNEKTESSRFLLSTNLAIGYLDESGWSLQSGLEYNEIMGFFNYSHINTDTIRKLNEAAFFILNSNADTLFFSDSSTVVRTEEKIIRHWNKQPYFSIPLEVGYRKAVGKSNVFGTVGISYAFAYNFKGLVNQLNEDGTNEIVENPNFILKSRIGYKLSLGTEIPLIKQTHLFLNVSYRRNPRLAGESKEQFYQSCTFGAGIRAEL